MTTPRPGGPAPLRAVVYARISLDPKGEGLGVARQIEDCAALIEQRGFLHTETYTDNDISASTGKRRPAYEAMLQAIEAGEVDVVVTWNTDRLHRRLVELERYVDLVTRRSVRTLTCKAGEIDLDTAAGRTIARILGSVAAGESETKAERVRAKRAQEARSGQAHGPLGYGYNSDRTINPDEAAIVREVADRLLRGETLYAVSADLSERGVPSPGASKWVAKQVPREYLRQPELRPLIDALRSDEATPEADLKQMLTKIGVSDWTVASPRADEEISRWLLEPQRPCTDGRAAKMLQHLGVPAPVTTWRAANLGVMIRRGALCGWRDFGPGKRGGYGEMVAQGDWSPILERETTDALRLLLDNRKHPVRSDGLPRGGRQPKYLLAGVLVCGECGGKMYGHTGPHGVIYACQRLAQAVPPRCGRMSIRANPTEEFIVEAVLTALGNADLRRRRSRGPDANDEATASADLLRLRAEMQTYAAMAGQGAISPAEYLAIREGLDARMKAAEKVLGERSAQVQRVLEGVPTIGGDLRAWWDAAPLSTQRKVLTTLIEAIPISRAAGTGGKGRDAGIVARIGDPIWRI